MAHVASITYKPAIGESRPTDRFSRIAVDRVVLAAGHGVVGDRNSRADSRQLNVMLSEIIEQLKADGFRCTPGELGEQIVISGLGADIAVPGLRLLLGEMAIIELVYLRIPCGRFARIQKQSKDAARSRLGYMARVLVGGEVAVGAHVSVASFVNAAE
jgi:MOSC domain-containing protein YiiM